MKTFQKQWLAVALAMAFATTPALRAEHDDGDGGDVRKSSFGKNTHFSGRVPPAGSTGSVTPLISNHGGPVIATPTVYVVWYGNWNRANGTDTPAGQQIIRDFLQSVGGSPYFGINASYVPSSSTITGNVVWGGEATDTGSKGTSLSDSAVSSIVTSAIKGGKLPYNSSGIYFVLTSSDVNEASGFCTKYCGWHTASTLSGKGRLRYSFVGNAARCITSCAIQTVGPNGNAGVDGMISVIAHELEETTTDPDLNAWYDSSGAENGDKCAWTFGTTSLLPNGAYYNMTLGSRNYLIQRNLKIVSGLNYCVLN
jgi:hypothetical protein